MAGNASVPCNAVYPATQSLQGTHSYILTTSKYNEMATNWKIRKGVKIAVYHNLKSNIEPIRVDYYFKCC